MHDALTGLAVAEGGGMSVLIVDDDPEIRHLISVSLRSQGWDTVEAATGAQALAALAAQEPAAITLDVSLRGESGYDICRRIRAVSSVPVVFVTARSDEFDQVLGLELGADDFLTKPFSPRVLGARLASVVRRAARGRRPECLVAGPVTVDLAARRVHVGETLVDLSKAGFDLLAAMLAEPARVLSRQELLERVWGGWHADDDLTVLISRVRRKLAQAGAADFIETVHGIGYRLAAF